MAHHRRGITQNTPPASPPETTPSSPTTTLSSPTSPPTSSTPPPPPGTLPITLDDPAPAAPGTQQGGSPVPGTGGCTAIAGTHIAGTYYACTLAQTAPAYLPGTTDSRSELRGRQSPFLCESDGSSYSVGNRTNHWWAWVGYGNVGVWVPTIFLTGGPDNAPEPGLPVCGSAPQEPSTTPQQPSTAPQQPPRHLPKMSSPGRSGTDNGITDNQPTQTRRHG